MRYLIDDGHNGRGVPCRAVSLVKIELRLYLVSQALGVRQKPFVYLSRSASFSAPFSFSLVAKPFISFGI